MQDNYEYNLRKCIVHHCNSVEGDKISLFRLPKNIPKLKCWLSNVGRLDLLEKGPDFCYTNRRICALHFQQSMFTNILNNKLKKIAVPNKLVVTPKKDLSDGNIGASTSRQSDFSSSTPSNTHTASTSFEANTQTTPVLTCNSPRKQQLRLKIFQMGKYQAALLKKIENLERNNVTTSAQFLEYCRKNFNATIYHLMKAQEEARTKSSRGMRYSKEFKQFALGLYFLSPLAYISLRKTIHLPPKKCLMQMTRSWRIKSGFTNNFVLKALKLRTEHFNDDERECILCADEMPLKRFLFYNRNSDEIVGFQDTMSGTYDIPANNALIFMARAIKSTWKLPIAYFFVNDTCSVEDLKLMVNTAISNLFEAGLKVRSFVTDQCSNFYKLHRKLGVTSEHPYFYVGDHKIFYLFDVSHLLKSTRNNFLKYNFKYDGGIITRKHVDTIIQYDQTRERKICPTLTENHVNPSSSDKMKVKLAAQLLSNSVAVGLDSAVVCSLLPQEALHTAKFIELIDKLFDVLNSRSFAVSQVKVLEDAKTFFSGIEIIDNKNTNVTNKVRFLYGWKVTINAVEQLFNELECSTLSTRKLNEECLEKFKEKIRQGGKLKNPTPIQFQRAFKKHFCLNFMDINFNGNYTNYTADNEAMLLNFGEANMQKMEYLVERPVENYSILENDAEYVNLELPEENVEEYVCGYLLYKCLNKHSCNVCTNYARKDRNLTNERMYLQFRAYENRNKDIYGKLCVAPQSFSEYIKQLDNRFINIFSDVAHFPRFGLNIKTFLKTIYFRHPCSNFPYDYLLNLFVRFKIYKNLKFINRQYKDSTNKRAKLKNLMN